MNMRKKHGKTLSSVVDSRRKFGERHILRDGLRLHSWRGVGISRPINKGPPKSKLLSKRIQKFSSFSHRSNHEYAKKTRQNVVLCGGLEEKIWQEAYIKGWAQAT